MSNLIPAAVELNGVLYPVLDRTDLEDSLPYSWRPYQEKVEPAVVQQAELAGSSRPARGPRPDILEWRWDSWAGGEGQKFIDSREDDSFDQYYYSTTGGVDVRTKGQVTLGVQMTDDVAGLSTVTHGPFLAVTNGYLCAVASDRDQAATPGASAQRSRRKNLSTGVWSALTTGAAAEAEPTGKVVTMGTFLYVAHRSVATIRRVDPNANTNVNFVANTGESPNATDSKLFFIQDISTGNGGKLDLRTVALLQAAFPAATVTSRFGIEGIGLSVGADALGKRVAVVTQAVDEEPRVQLWDGSAGAERERLPVGFRMESGTLSAAGISKGDGPFPAVIYFANLLWCVGWRDGSGASLPKVPMIAVVTGQNSGRSGTVGLIRDGVYAADTKGVCLADGFRNQLLIGTDSGDAFIYDIQNAGISQLFSGVPSTEEIRSMVYTQGKYFFGVRVKGSLSQNGKVYSSMLSGANRYPATATLIGSTWDFNYPGVRKLITELEIQTAPLPAGTTVTLKIILNDETTITTDKDAVALTHSGTGATRTVFKISGLNGAGASIARDGRIARIEMTLNADGTGANTPTVFGVYLRALAKQFVQFFEFTARLEDDAPGTYTFGGGATTGLQKANNLRTLRDNDLAPPVNFIPHYRAGEGYMMPETDAPQFTVILEEADIVLTRKGNGFARVLVRRMP
jgi:hypothetical protein